MRTESVKFKREDELRILSPKPRRGIPPEGLCFFVLFTSRVFYLDETIFTYHYHYAAYSAEDVIFESVMYGHKFGSGFWVIAALPHL